MDLISVAAHDAWARQSEADPDVVVTMGGRRLYASKTCKLEGCGKDRSQDGFGYCSSHGKNFWRSGHPEGMRVKRLEALREAAHALGDDLTSRACRRQLAIAAVEYAMAYAPGSFDAETKLAAPAYAVDGMLRDEFAALAWAALEYTRFDAEEPLALFEGASERFTRRALEYGRCLPIPRVNLGALSHVARRAA